MTVEDAVEFFKHIPKIHRKLQTIVDIQDIKILTIRILVQFAGKLHPLRFTTR
jgi:excinuclease ABC subunit A